MQKSFETRKTNPSKLSTRWAIKAWLSLIGASTGFGRVLSITVTTGFDLPKIESMAFKFLVSGWTLANNSGPKSQLRDAIGSPTAVWA